MIRLGDLPTYGFAPQDGAFAGATVIVPDELADIKGPALIIADGVLPDGAAEDFVLEHDIATCGRAVVIPTISAVTGGFVDRGLTFVPEGQGGDVEDALVVPMPGGTYHNNASPDQAFRAAHSLWLGVALPDTEQGKRLALELSIGADADNGEWWQAGALAGVLGVPVEPELEALLSDPTELFPRLQVLSAKLRQSGGAEVCILDRPQSAAARSMLTRLAPVDYWTRFITACTDMGLVDTAARYDTAAQRIWG